MVVSSVWFHSLRGLYSNPISLVFQLILIHVHALAQRRPEVHVAHIIYNKFPANSNNYFSTCNTIFRIFFQSVAMMSMWKYTEVCVNRRRTWCWQGTFSSSSTLEEQRWSSFVPISHHQANVRDYRCCWKSCTYEEKERDRSRRKGGFVSDKMKLSGQDSEEMSIAALYLSSPCTFEEYTNVDCSHHFHIVMQKLKR